MPRLIHNVNFDAEPFIGEDGRYHYIYLITNLVNGKYYKGVHSTDDLDDGYSGSGVILNEAKEKYGSKNFSLKIIKFFNSREEALEGESNYITEEDVKSEKCYNVSYGGANGVYQRVTVRDKDGNYKSVPVDSSLYLSGEFVSNMKGMHCYVDNDGNKIIASTYDERVLNGELVSINKDMVLVVDENGNHFKVSTSDENYLNGTLKWNLTGLRPYKDKYGNTKALSPDDSRVLSGEYVSTSTGRVLVIDASGNYYNVDNSDVRLTTGELVPISKGRIVVKDKFGNNMVVPIGDERFLNHELVGINKGKVVVKDKDNNIFLVSTEDERYLSGELVSFRKGKVNAYNTITGKKEYVSSSDERFSTGELVGLAKGKISAYNMITKEKEYVLCSDERFLTGELILFLKFNKRMIDKTGKVSLVNLLSEKFKTSFFYEIPISDNYVHCTNIIGEEYYVLKTDERLKNNQLFEYIKIYKKRNNGKRKYGNRYRFTSVTNLLKNLDNGWLIVES